jgi:PAS domain S-box-containing protein
MKDEDRTKEQLMDELAGLRQRVMELEASETEYKHLGEALRASEAQKRAILDATVDRIRLVDRDLRIVWANQTTTRSLNVASEDLVGRHCYEAFHGRDLPCPECASTRALKTGKMEHTVLYRPKEQEVLKGQTYVDSYGIPIKNESGNVVSLIQVNRDITQAKMLEEALRIKDRAMESSINAIAIAEIGGNLIYVNKSFLTLWGYDSDQEVLGRSAQDFWGVKGKALGVIEALQEQGSWAGELVAKRKDGSLFDAQVSASIVTDSSGNSILMMGSFLDVTDLKQALEELRESEEKYRTLFENASDAIFIVDGETHLILDANRQAERLIDRPREEIIGMHPSKLHPPHQADYYKEKFRGHVQRGRVLDPEAEVIKKDGTIVPVLLTAGFLTLHGKEVIQGIFRDISEEQMILELKHEIEARKLIEKAKGILMDHHRIGEKEAMRRLQKESRRQRKKIKDIAQGVISSELILK